MPSFYALSLSVTTGHDRLDNWTISHFLNMFCPSKVSNARTPSEWGVPHTFFNFNEVMFLLSTVSTSTTVCETRQQLLIALVKMSMEVDDECVLITNRFRSFSLVGTKNSSSSVASHIIHRNENKRCFSLLSSSLLSIVKYTSIILA